MKSRLLPAFLLGLASSCFAQQIGPRVAVGPAGAMPAPSYATKYLPTTPPRLAWSDAPNAGITYHITFADPSGPYSPYYPALTAITQAAGAAWNRYLAGSGSIEIEIVIDDAGAVRGGSVAVAFVRNDGTRNIYEPGAAFEIRTGTDPNGADPDIRIFVGSNSLTNSLWFDPHPETRTDPIPQNKIDALSLFLHQLGHAFLFTGWINGDTGELPANYMSTFDEHILFDGSNFFFTGINADANYGGPVPLTYGNPYHLGNDSPRPGSDLLADAMNGVGIYGETRYDVLAVDGAIAKDLGVGLASRLLNVATRMRVQSGDNVLIAGFIITGTDSKKVIIRGIGPSLAQFFTGVLADPTLELFQGNTLLASNDDWKESQAEVQDTGIAPSHDLEAAIVRTLPPGSYSAILRGTGNTSGIGVVEMYDLDQLGDSKLANISTRGFVEAANNVMIAGLTVGPVGGARTKVVVRALGPSLSNFGIAGALQDPTLELADSNGVVIGSNNDWKTGQPAEISGTGLQPSDDREPALVGTLAPGQYTAIVRGNANTTGVAIVEAYNVE